MTADSLARAITHALGGDWSGSGGQLPGIGHSQRDRSVSITDHPDNPDDVLVHSFAGDDSLEFKRHLRERGLLPQRAGTGTRRIPDPAVRPRAAVGLTNDQLRTDHRC
jgi:hypothetical protein